MIRMVFGFSLFLVSADALATNYGNWKFVKQNGLTSIVNSQGITVAAPGTGPAATGTHGINIFGIPQATLPSGKTTMIMQFDFRSNGYLTKESGAHIPIALSGKWRNTNPTPPTPGAGAGYIVGRGIVIGAVSGHPQGCSVGRIVEIESFRQNGNALYPSSCSAGGTNGHNVVLNDYTTYHFVIYSSNTEYIEGQHYNVIYSLLDSSNNLILQ